LFETLKFDRWLRAGRGEGSRGRGFHPASRTVIGGACQTERGRAHPFAAAGCDGASAENAPGIPAGLARHAGAESP
jgi:hypothetical protein